MLSINQTTTCFLNSIRSPNYSPVTSPKRISGCTRWVWHARNILTLTMQTYVKPSLSVTRCNYSWLLTAPFFLLYQGRDSLPLRTSLLSKRENEIYVIILAYSTCYFWTKLLLYFLIVLHLLSNYDDVGIQSIHVLGCTIMYSCRTLFQCSSIILCYYILSLLL